MGEKDKSLMNIEGLKTYYTTPKGPVKAVDDCDLAIGRGEAIGLVGESGSGKTTLGLSIMKLVSPPGKIMSGKIFFENEDLVQKSESDMADIRGSKIAMVYQEPMTALNPVFRIGDQVAEVIVRHQRISKKKALEKALTVMESVLIPSAKERAKDFPHQFSGGMRQRIVMAMALACDPKLVIADEPTSMIDLISQAQIVGLFKNLKSKLKTSILYITHDLGLVAELCDRVVVMYSGKIMEVSDIYSLFDNPAHPYTQALLKSIPRVDKPAKDLVTIPGSVPDLINTPRGCRYWPRCEFAQGYCKENEPKLLKLEENQKAACFRAREIH